MYVPVTAEVGYYKPSQSNSTQNIQNRADKSRKTYVTQLGTQSSIRRKNKSTLVMKRSP